MSMKKIMITKHENKICKWPGCRRQATPTGKIRKRDGLKTRQTHCGYHKKVMYNMSGSEYVKYKKDYCENIDGRLGFKCTTTIVDKWYQLETDHIDENHENNIEENMQTLCACCHRIKTKYTNTKDTKALKLMMEYIDGTKR